MTLLVSERSLMIRNKFRSVLQLRLQHRRTREQLAEQGIVTPLKGPSAFIDQQRSLERAKTEDFLKHKIRSRPERTDLVKMNILEDAVANPTQMKQKKARLAHNLNEKILHRPGPLELVEKNILPLNSSVKEAMKVGQIHLRQPSDPSPFEDDSSSSSNSSSPEQPGSHQSQSTAGSPQQPTDQPITSSSAPLQGPLAMPQRVQLHAAIPELVAESNATATSGHGNGQLVPVAPLATGLPRASESSKPQRHKKPKEPKVKKLKYHQYIPPDQKAEKCPVAMDAAYSRLLQQQQIFLQLQILNQQQHQQAVSYQTIQPGTAGLPPDHIIGFASAVPNPVPCVPLSTMTKSCQRASIVASAKPELLPANLDDLTVSELRQQLRKRGLPVSGTKPALLERLKPYQIASPKPAPLSLAQLPPAAAAPATGAKEEVSLVEKEKVIERLTWKLQQEQRQAEDLRLELERRKRRQRHQAPEASGLHPAPPPPPFPSLVFPTPGVAVETSRDPHASAPMTCDPGVTARPPSRGSPFFFTSMGRGATSAIDGRGSQQGHSGDGNLSTLMVPHSVQADFPYSPASLPCFFQLEDEDLEAKNESGAEGHFESEVFLSASLGSEARDYGSLEALASSDSGGFQSLEDELTEAIKSAELSQSHSIEDILEEHLMSTEASPSLDQGLDHSPDCLKERGRPEAQRLSPQALSVELGGLPQYEVFGVSDLLSGPFSPMCSSPSSSPSPSSSSCPSPERQGPRPHLTEITFDPADWIDPLPGGSAAGLGPSGDPSAPSIFSTDFLEAPELNINRMIDLLVERW